MIMMVMMIIMERIRAVVNKSRIKVKVVMIMYIRIALFSVLRAIVCKIRTILKSRWHAISPN